MNVILALGCTAKENTGKDQESRRTARKYSALWLQKQPIVLSFCRKFFEKTKFLSYRDKSKYDPLLVASK